VTRSESGHASSIDSLEDVTPLPFALGLVRTIGLWSVWASPSGAPSRHASEDRKLPEAGLDLVPTRENAAHQPSLSRDFAEGVSFGSASPLLTLTARHWRWQTVVRVVPVSALRPAPVNGQPQALPDHFQAFKYPSGAGNLHSPSRSHAGARVFRQMRLTCSHNPFDLQNWTAQQPPDSGIASRCRVLCGQWVRRTWARRREPPVGTVNAVRFHATVAALTSRRE
jgi:hypothetical protein